MAHLAQETPVLNFDTLHNVVSLVDNQRDLSCFMRTCRLIHSMGVPALLRLPIWFISLSAVESFCSFMLADHGSSPDRFQYLTDIALLIAFENGEQDQRVAELLCTVISKASSLKRVDMSSHAESILSSTPAMLSAFSNLPAIQSLRLSGSGSTTIEFLKTTRSPISSLNLSFYNPYVGSYPMDQFILLKNIKDTLTKLDVFNCDPESMEVQFPRLHTLTIRTVNRVSISALVHACPNLRNLNMKTLREKFLDDDAEMEKRDLNRKAQRRLPECWSVLHSLSGTSTVLFSLGLLCVVRKLEIWSIDRGDLLKWTLHLLRDHRPTRLKLSFWVGVDTLERPEYILREVFGASNLKGLTLKVSFYEVNVKLAEQTVDTIAKTMQSTSLQYLSLKFSYQLVDYTKDPDGIGESFKQMDFNSLALRIAHNIGTLMYLVIEPSWEPLWGIKLYWRLGRNDDGGVFATQMTKEAGGTAITGLCRAMVSSTTD